MEGMYDWPYYIPFNTHDNYPVPSRRPIPSPYMDRGYYRDRVTPVYRPSYQPRTRTRTPTRSDYAVKIQKAFRGFRIRKNLRKIIELKRGVDEVERNLMEDDSIELIIRDDRYRLKVTEALMALLLKLDSVVALNDAVRVCRKVVIRKAISLQEMIDSLVEETLVPIAEETLVPIVETLCEVPIVEPTLDYEPIVEPTLDYEPIVETLDYEPIVETLDEVPIVEEPPIDETLVSIETMQIEDKPIVEEPPIDETLVSIETMQIEDKDSESEEEEAWECVDDDDDDDDGKVVDNVEFEKEEEDDGKQGWLVVEEEDNKLLMSKMAEDNRRLMKMIAELCNKNDNQTRLIQTLSNRVDQLEQAMNDRITTKTDKKKNRHD